VEAGGKLIIMIVCIGCSYSHWVQSSIAPWLSDFSSQRIMTTNGHANARIIWQTYILRDHLLSRMVNKYSLLWRGWQRTYNMVQCSLYVNHVNICSVNVSLWRSGKAYRLDAYRAKRTSEKYSILINMDKQLTRKESRNTQQVERDRQLCAGINHVYDILLVECGSNHAHVYW